MSAPVTGSVSPPPSNRSKNARTDVAERPRRARIAGIISARDLTRALGEETDPRTVTASRYTTTQLEVALLNDDTYQIAHQMLQAVVRHLPVMDDHELVGMVSMRDLLAVETWT